MKRPKHPQPKQPKPNASRGRQRTQWPMFESSKSFAAWGNYTIEVVKFAKAKNCAGFLSGNRIDPGLLVPAINELLNAETELPAGYTSWREFGESRRAKIADLELDEKKKLLMPIADAKKQNGEAWAFVDAKLERHVLEDPPDYAGRSAVEIGIRLRNFKETTMREARSKFEKAA